MSDAIFTENCTQCDRCIDACETKILTRDNEGFPVVDFDKGECTFCTACHQVCDQSNNLLQPADARHALKPWSLVLSISAECLAKNKVFCQSCRDVCESNAIDFSYFLAGKTNSIPQPTINADDCTQCGACIAGCPQSAIAFRPNETI
ncbi:MAG: ferredoxin-type protein NapF [Gammaproteobacteria bacterium]|jgi:ferredoxin-type protein NapF